MNEVSSSDTQIVLIDSTINEASAKTGESMSQGGESVATSTIQQPPIFPSTNQWVDLVGHIAWPVVFLIALFVFRNSIIQLIDDIEEGGFGSAWGKRKKTGKTKAPPSSGPETESSKDVSVNAKKMLATLWKYQQRHHGRTFNENRWTFLVSPASPKYSSYLSALSECVNMGLAVVSPQSMQCFLTNTGLRYCQENEEVIRDKGDFWEE